MTSTTTCRVDPSGPFDLARLARFGFGHRHQDDFDGTMRMAMVGDDLATSAGVGVRQHDDGSLAVEIISDGSASGHPAILGQVKRTLSLDHNGSVFVEVGHRDPVIERLQALAPGLRPVLFHSPYEAAAWSVLSARRPAEQMAKVRAALCESIGEGFEVAGTTAHAFPTPDRLVDLDEHPGLNDAKVRGLRGVAEAALDGRLGIDHLRGLGPKEAVEELQEIPGIGPFYASLVVVRAMGYADLDPPHEKNLLALSGRLYGTGVPSTLAQLTEVAEQWRPFRVWAAVLVRSTGPTLLEAEG
jgi:DNA-3-methyladenine glycosylase II